MSEYEFTQDWFNWAPEVWTQLIPHLPERRAFLEIGSFEGRSAVWIAENMAQDGSHIDCIDTWEGGEEHSAEDMAAVEAAFDHNVRISNGYYGGGRLISKYKETSTYALANRIIETAGGNLYDFIYIDGSHVAKDVLTDACMAWPLLKPKGLMVFDDYLWTPSTRDILHRPKMAIDAFTNLFAEEVEIVHVGYQLVVRKKGE
jgi:predicted O-methyltransferase YrrM